MEDLFKGRAGNIDEVMARVKSAAVELGLPFVDRTHTYNSRGAQELGKWAEEKGRGEEFHHAAFHAYFAEGKNIAEPEVLKEIAGRAGLSEGEAKEAIGSEKYKAAVDSDWELSKEKRIRAVPTFFANGSQLVSRLVGAQPYEALERLLIEAGIPRRSEKSG